MGSENKDLRLLAGNIHKMPFDVRYVSCHAIVIIETSVMETLIRQGIVTSKKKEKWGPYIIFYMNELISV